MQTKNQSLAMLTLKKYLLWLNGLLLAFASSASLAVPVSFSTEIVNVNEGVAHAVGFLPGDPVMIHYDVNPAAVDGDFAPQIGLFDPGVLSMSIEFPASGLILDFDEGQLWLRSDFPSGTSTYPDEFAIRDFLNGTGVSLGGDLIQIAVLYFGSFNPTLFDFTEPQIPLPTLLTGVPFGFDFSELTLDTGVAGGITVLELSSNISALLPTIDARILDLISEVEVLELGTSFYAHLLHNWYLKNLSIAYQRHQAGFDKLAAIHLFWFAVSVESQRGRLISEPVATALSDEAFSLVELLIYN